MHAAAVAPALTPPQTLAAGGALGLHTLSLPAEPAGNDDFHRRG